MKINLNTRLSGPFDLLHYPPFLFKLKIMLWLGCIKASWARVEWYQSRASKNQGRTSTCPVWWAISLFSALPNSLTFTFMLLIGWMDGWLWWWMCNFLFGLKGFIKRKKKKKKSRLKCGSKGKAKKRKRKQRKNLVQGSFCENHLFWQLFSSSVIYI